MHSPPFEASKKAESFCRFSFPRSLNAGIGEPGFTQLGHSRCETWNSIPLFFPPSAERSGAPRFDEPVPRYVWQLVQPDSAKRFAPSSACLLPAKPCLAAQLGIAALTSLAIASSAVAPLYVSAPIARTVSAAPTTATGRLESRRSVRRSMNGSTSSRIRQIVGMPTVARITDSGHLKIRSR